ncbi:TetR/AcrR family transcriptional regulator [Glycomyces harbinensis]|uniref:Transcriptional regulator, TetR family n=1 Tax=Glycomyces harbinensis TaxID=58114 RepID=A0A1G6VCZ3_9ACTN|nr:TetR/AcrR family transcriptional regulator [Glycomyces harbinensis]SDD50877.1 transcriptional regulator, TetR family [Glycomyces harbinensis]
MQRPNAPAERTGADAPRADARRNRAKVLAAAQAAFAKEGTGVSLGEIARRAGVGAGTVYRHFPTKEALLEAVLSQRLERLTRLAAGYAEAPDPGAAFFDFVTEVVVSTPANQDLCELLGSEDGWPRAVLLASGRRSAEALAALLEAAQRAGAVRADLDAEGVQAIFTACVAIQRMRPDRGGLAPMSALVIDALRSDDGRDSRYESRAAAGKRNDAPTVCASCGAPITRTGPGRPARFCGPACRQKAYRQRRVRAAS